MRSPALGILLAAATLAAGPAGAIVYEGSPAPPFTKQRLDGGTASLSDYAGKVLVLFMLGNT